MIDIRIMAHPSRKENVEKILASLSLSPDIVIYDERENGGDAMYTAQKAWNLPLYDGCTHRLVLQDDIEICDNFLEIVEIVAQKHQSELVSFFHCEKYDGNVRYEHTRRVWGCALMLPAKLISSCWDYIRRIPEKSWCDKPEIIMRHDTDCIFVWAIENNIPIINTVPSLVQHIGNNSLVGIKEKRVAPDFIKLPPVTGW